MFNPDPKDFNSIGRIQGVIIMPILLLYDTTESDLARDLRELLAELDLEIIMIPSSPSFGKNLQAKEEHYVDSADGMIFLITPGSERLGKLFPSPSVTDEMGQARQKFKHSPERVIYLVDKECNLQAIDQKSYISFDRTNRTNLEAITLLIKDLNQSGLFRRKEIEPKEMPGVKDSDIAEKSNSINDTIKQICFDLSDKPYGLMTDEDFNALLKNKYKLTDRSINFIKKDLQLNGLALYLPPQLERMPYFYGGWRLSNIGFEIVRYEIHKERAERLRKKVWSAALKKLNVDVKKMAQIQRKRALERAFQKKES